MANKNNSISLNNELFDLVKIKYELEFINKIKNFERFEWIKDSLKNEFSDFLMDNKHKFYLKFYEMGDVKNIIESHPM